MTASVEIKTGERSVLSYLLRPMLKSQEALRRGEGATRESSLDSGRETQPLVALATLKGRFAKRGSKALHFSVSLQGGQQ